MGISYVNVSSEGCDILKMVRKEILLSFVYPIIKIVLFIANIVTNRSGLKIEPCGFDCHMCSEMCQSIIKFGKLNEVTLYFKLVFLLITVCQHR